MSKNRQFISDDPFIRDKYSYSIIRKLDKQYRFYMPIRYIPNYLGECNDFLIFNIRNSESLVLYPTGSKKSEILENYELINESNIFTPGKSRLAIPPKNRIHISTDLPLIIDIYDDKFFALRNSEK